MDMGRRKSMIRTTCHGLEMPFEENQEKTIQSSQMFQRQAFAAVSNSTLAITEIQKQDVKSSTSVKNLTIAWTHSFVLMEPFSPNDILCVSGGGNMTVPTLKRTTRLMPTSMQKEVLTNRITNCKMWAQEETSLPQVMAMDQLLLEMKLLKLQLLEEYRMVKQVSQTLLEERKMD